MDRGIRVFWLLVCVLLLAALFFALGAEARRHELQDAPRSVGHQLAPESDDEGTGL